MSHAFITHNDAKGEPIDISWTQVQGYIQATPAQLTLAFGTPIKFEGNPSNPVNLTWHLLLNDGNEEHVVTIYDWMGPLPAPAEVISWRIGGHSRRAAELLHAVFREAIAARRAANDRVFA